MRALFNITGIWKVNDLVCHRSLLSEPTLRPTVCLLVHLKPVYFDFEFRVSLHLCDIAAKVVPKKVNVIGDVNPGENAEVIVSFRLEQVFHTVKPVDFFEFFRGILVFMLVNG